MAKVAEAHASMKVREIAQRIDARIHPEAGPDLTDVRRVYGADTMSDLIENASPDTLLVTSLNNTQLARVAELMDAPGICLASGARPSADLCARARAAGTAILTSAHGVAETRRMIEACLADAAAPNGAAANAPNGAAVNAPNGAAVNAPNGAAPTAPPGAEARAP
jgi:hypothetical protein